MEIQKNTRHRVYSAVRSRIVTLEYPPGMALSETDLGAELGVSRTPIREALLHLADDRLVDVRPRVGTFVTPVSMDMVREAQFLREAIETASVRSLADHLPLRSADSSVLRTNLELQEEAVAEGDNKRFFELDEDFHRRLLMAADHEYSWSVVNNAKAHLDRARLLGFEGARPISYYCAQHRDIFDALIDGDVHRAATLLTAHLRHVLDDIEEVRAKVPELFADEAGGSEPGPGSLISRLLRARVVTE